MRRIWKYGALLLGGLFWLFPAGCITEYTHPGVESLTDLLVVEGMITDGESAIKLSRSIALDDRYPEVVMTAQVWVDLENGTEIAGTLSDETPGTYIIPTGDLDPDTRYRLRVQVDGESYASEYLAPVFTPPIEKLDRHKRAKRDSVEFRMTSIGDDSYPPYYLWSYEEIWEIHANLRATVYQLDPPTGTLYFQEPHSPFYYCWKYGGSQSLLLGTTIRLSENRIDNLVLFDVEPWNDRINTDFYYIKVRQNCLREAAYFYFSQLKTNVEEIGSIFGVVPSEMRGNISCLTDPEIPVIGYVEVSQTQTKEVFWGFDADLFELNSYGDRCSKSTTRLTSAQEMFKEWHKIGVLSYNPISNDTTYVYRECVDCRLSGGTKIKPDFWPNNHE